MYCKHCGKQIDNDSAFCQHCGKVQHIQNENIQLESKISILESKELFQDSITKLHYEPQHVPSETLDKNVDKITNNVGIENKNKQSSIYKKQRGMPIAVFVSVIAALALVAAIFFSGIFNNSRHELSATEIAKLSNSVLTLYVYDKNHDLISTGSGFVVNDDKTIVTNYHVIDQGYFVEAVSEADVHYNVSGATFFDEIADIAVLQFETNTGLSPLAIADSSSAQVGDTVYAIGSPLGLKNTVSNGIISAIRKEAKYSNIQITAPISAGSSGGVLLNIYGEVLGITYASYSDGQNLNLAIPSREFVDKLQNSKVQQFEDIALFYAPLGNSIENYSTSETRLVQYSNLIFESYNSKDEISIYDIETKESKKLGITGTNLSVYHGVLYYLSSGSAIGTYDISTGEICENILLNYPIQARVDTISGLYISNHGITIIYDFDFLNYALIQLDFDGAIIGDINNLPSDAIMADTDTLVCYDYENWALVFISLFDLDILSVPVDFEPGSICADKDGYLYISDTTKNKHGYHVKFDLHTGDYTRIDRLDAQTYGCFVYNGKIFYPASNGTNQVSVLGSGWTTINKEYALTNICFADDGTLYGFGKLPSEFNQFLEYTKYYVRMNLDGTQVEVLDIEKVNWLN